MTGTSFRSAFKAIAHFHERPNSETILFSGVTDEDLTNPGDDLVELLSRRIGLTSDVSTTGTLLVGNTRLPGVMRVGADRFIALLSENTDGSFEAVGLDSSDQITRVTKEQLSQHKGKEFTSFSRIYLNKGTAAQTAHKAEIEKKHWFSGTISRFWRSYIIVALAAFFINVIALASPLFVMNVYDRVLPNEAITTLWVLAIGVFVAFFFDFLLKLARAAVVDYTGRKIDIRLSQLIFEKILTTSIDARPFSTGEFASRATQYEFVREFFSSNTLATLIDTAFIFVFLITIWMISGWLVVVPIVAFFAVLIIGFTAQYFISQRIAAAANEAAQRQSLLVETISVAETVKSLRAEGVLLKRWRELSINSTRTAEEIKQISSTTASATQLVQQLVSVFVIIGGAYLFQAGVVTTGAIIATVILSGRAIAPLGQLAMTIARFRQVMLSLSILNSIMEQPDDVPSSTGFVNRVVERGAVTFENVEFSYVEDGQPALNSASFKIEPGERVGIIGKIGSGKTTLGRLMSALYTAKSGRVLLDGIDVRQYHPAEVRSAVAVAGQSSDLFAGTIKENLLMANAQATDGELVEVARLSGINSFVERHPLGFDMQVGENGNALSSGQKQSVTIARLLLAKPKIVFLDEPSGAMDQASERSLIMNLENAFSDETTLIVATHRYSMLELVDRLIVLDQGKVIADGPKEKVIEALQKQRG